MKQLYHFTSLDGLMGILNDGRIKHFKSHSSFPCVWLTPESDFFAAAYKHGIPYGRTEIRIAFDQDGRFKPWYACVVPDPAGTHEIAFHMKYTGWKEQWISRTPVDINTAVEIVFRPDVAEYIEYCKSLKGARK